MDTIAGDKLKFHQQLSAYEDWKLRKIYEYFRDDLNFIVESLNITQLLAELQSRTPQNWEDHVKIKEDLGASEFSVKLIQDILNAGRKAILGFWESLHVLFTDSLSPNLSSVLDEIKTGENLVQQILLDECGHSFIPEVREIHEYHKKCLLRTNQNLVEKQPPRSTFEQQSFQFSERFVNLVVVSSKQFRQHSKNELIETGIRHERCLYTASSRLEHISPNRLFRWCHLSGCVPCMVMISGVPGVGKTTLMQKFVYDWLNGKHYQRFSFVFFFKFRELNKITEISLERLILWQYPYLQPQLENILQNPEHVLFIFDGLDESVHQMDFRSSPLCSNMKYARSLGVLVVSLVRQSLLKGCSVLMTSRPTKLASIDLEAFQRVSEIMGFFSKERQLYFERFCEDKNVANKMFQYVKENDNLYTFCYIPSYCWIICTVLSACFKGNKLATNDQLMSSMPRTVTQLFATYIANILLNHSQECSGARQLLSSIGRMAEYGVMNHIVIFDEKHLKSFSVDIHSKLLSSFMAEAGQPPAVTFSFLHLTIQEFFAALVHYIDYSPEKLQKSLREAKSFEDNRADLFLRLLCGLSDFSTSKLFKPYLGELSSATPKVIISWLQNSIREVWMLDEYKDDNRQLLTAFVYLSETRNRALVLESLGSNKSFDFSYVPLSPLDCSLFPFILESCKETKRLNLESSSIQKEGLERLVRALHTVEDLSLRDNNLKDEGIKTVCTVLKHPRCRIQKLCLSSNGLTQNSFDHLAPIIRNNQSLRSLDLSYNNMDGPKLSDLMTALSSESCRIEELLLNCANLTHTSCSQLASAIKESQSLRKLDLTDNRLEGPHFSDLMTALSSPTCRIEELVLSCDSRKLDSSCTQLDSAICSSQSLRSLNLSGSCLIGPMFTCITKVLSNPSCKLQELILKDSRLTDGSSSQLASALSQNQSLRKLDLSYNHLVGPHLRDLITALSSPTCRIEELQLEKVGMTSEHAPLLLSLKNNKSLSVLNVGRNSFGDNAHSNITDQLLGNLKELRIAFSTLYGKKAERPQTGTEDLI